MQALYPSTLLSCLAAVLAATSGRGLADELLIENFESGDYSAWRIEGTAFGDAPAAGALPNQMAVSGYRGDGLVNTFVGGDQSVGSAVRTGITIQRSHIAFLIGGGTNNVGIELRVDGDVVRSAAGSESEELEWSSWDVSEFRGRTAEIRIFDDATGGWGHINVDHIIQTDSPPERFDLEYKLELYRQSADYLQEPLRPQFHFSPEINWMNDPNGLVYHDGEYHLFYQYNPAGNSWGHMSWGHAVSSDLTHWEHLPLAIPEADGIMAFSGCCVVDHQNTSGFGSTDASPMVAIYTGHGHGKQVQNLAFSNNRGRTWKMYEGNPVLDIGEHDFRDPKVFWHEPTEKWVMVVSLAAEKVLVFYSSADLKSWTELSRFGPAGTPHKPNWECPDLFELPIEDEDGSTLWVLEVDMGSGATAGSSGGEYFVGEFDGRSFTPLQEARWVDFGRDFYAPVSWSDIPGSDGRRIWIGWFNNWQTCLVPTSPWRSCMSVPRTLSLRQIEADDAVTPSHYVLVQRPVQELDQLRGQPMQLDTGHVAWPPVAVTQQGDIAELCFILHATLRLRSARSCGFRLRTDEAEYTEIGYDAHDGVAYVDRHHSGNVGFHPAFAGRHIAPARLIDDRVTLQIIVDRSTVEVFVNDGEAVISDRIFPRGNTPVIEAFAGNDTAEIQNATLLPMHSVWKRRPSRP